MASIVHSGMLWEVSSPSFWRLSPRYYHESGGSIDLSFLGDKWFLHVVEPQGTVIMRECVSRDEGIAFVANACQQYGVPF